MSKSSSTRYDRPTVVLPLHNLKAKYRTLLSVPMNYRPEELRTVSQFANYYHLSPSLLRQWEAEPNFWDGVFDEARAVIGRAMADILDALVQRAEGGNVNAIKLSLEILGVHHDKLEVQHTQAADQILLVIPEGMNLPDLPAYGSSAALEDGSVLTQSHIDDDMDFVLTQLVTPAKVPKGTLMNLDE